MISRAAFAALLLTCTPVMSAGLVITNASGVDIVELNYQESGSDDWETLLDPVTS